VGTPAGAATNGEAVGGSDQPPALTLLKPIRVTGNLMHIMTFAPSRGGRAEQICANNVR
jgi:hypothetical protein